MTADEKKTIEMLQKIRNAVESGALPVEQFPMTDMCGLISATMGDSFVVMASGFEQEQFRTLVDGYCKMLEHSVEIGDVAGCVRMMALLEEQYRCLDGIVNACRDKKYVEVYQKVTGNSGGAYSELQYYLHESQRRKKESKHHLGTNGKGVVYTCTGASLYGLQQPEYIHPEWDYICFTNDKGKIGIKDGVWEYRGIPTGNGVDAELLYHMCVVKPHLLLPEYDFSIWVNPNYKIVGDMELFLASYGRNTSCLAFPSYITDNVYDIMYTGLRGDDENISVRKKCLQYQKEGYPQHYGMISDKIIIRNHRCEKMCQVMETWWDEALECGRMWEYGFVYAAWKHEFDYAICDVFLEVNPYFKSMLIDLEVKERD